VIRNMRYFCKMRPSQFWLFGFAGWKEYRQFRKQDPHAMYLWCKTKSWFIVTVLLWALGFAVLAVTLFLMDKHGLLIGGIE
ncbi:MAG: hypothetical protein NTV22_06965, partial [bacterium]|nr:hypothetical protein [bacterium]